MLAEQELFGWLRFFHFIFEIYYLKTSLFKIFVRFRNLFSVHALHAY